MQLVKRVGYRVLDERATIVCGRGVAFESADHFRAWGDGREIGLLAWAAGGRVWCGVELVSCRGDRNRSVKSSITPFPPFASDSLPLPQLQHIDVNTLHSGQRTMPTRSQAGNTPLFELGRDGTPLVIIDSTPPAQMTTPLPLPPPVSVSQVGYAVSLTSESDSAPVDQVSAVASSPSVTVETTPDPERGGPPPIPVGSSPSQGRAGPESSEAESGAKRRKTKGPASVKIPGGVSGLIDYLNAHLDKAGQDSIPSHGGQAVYDAINKLASLGSEPKANPVATPWSGDAMREINLMKWTEMISQSLGQPTH